MIMFKDTYFKWELEAELKYLRAMRATLTHPDNWIKWRIANDDQGKATNAQDPKAVSWCLVGSLFKEVEAINPNRKIPHLFSVLRVDSLSSFNDDPRTTHEDILTALDKTIVVVEEELRK